MNLLEYLTTRQSNELQDIAVRLGLFGFESSKQRLASGILRKLTTPNTLRTILDELSEEAYEILRFLVIRRNAPSYFQDFLHVSEERTREQFLAALKELTNLGLIGSRLDPEARKERFFLFGDCEPHLLEILRSELPEPLKVVKPPKNVHSHPRVWRDDLVTFLGYCVRNELKLTKRNQPGRRDQKNLDPLLRGLRLADLYERFTGAPMDWTGRLIHFLGLHDLASMKGERFELAEGAMPRAVDIFEREGRAGLRALEKTSPFHFGVDYPALGELVVGALAAGAGWRSVAALKQSIFPHVSFFLPREPGDPVRGALFDLMTLGLCDIGEEEGEWYWRPHPPEEALPATARGLIHIQPNFEIVAPSALPMEARFVLETIADLVSVDQLLHYRITRESVYGALCRGWSASRQIEWYRDQITERRQLPQNVERSIEAWGACFGRVSVEEPLLLVCDTPELAEELLHSKELAGLCIGLFSPTSLVLRKSCAFEAMEALRKLGQMPQPEIGDGSRWAALKPPRHESKRVKGPKEDWDI
jgi:hypothetical protein